MAPLNACPVCSKPYGLVRHYYGRTSLCSMYCLDDYLNRRHLGKPPDKQIELPLPDTPQNKRYDVV